MLAISWKHSLLIVCEGDVANDEDDDEVVEARGSAACADLQAGKRASHFPLAELLCGLPSLAATRTVERGAKCLATLLAKCHIKC